MIYTDGVQLISDQGVEELMQYGETVGLKAKWLRYGDANNIHFDIAFGSLREKIMKDPEVKKVNGTMLVIIKKQIKNSKT